MSFFDKINRAKQGADSLLDPFLVLAGYNLATLEGTYRLIEDGDPLKVAAGVLGGGLALTWGNKTLINGKNSPLFRLGKKAVEEYNSKKSADWKNWVKTAAMIGALGFGLQNAQITNPRQEIYNPITPHLEISPKGNQSPLEDLLETKSTPLLGKTVLKGTLHSYYTGIEGTFTDISKLPSNKEVLTNLWDKKFEKYEKNGAKKQLYEAEVLKFDEANNHKISLTDYINQFDQIIDEINDNVDWQTLKGRYIWGNNKDEKLELLIELSKRASADQYVSIAMKELFPGDNPEYNAETLDNILSIRGKEFANMIPSLHDDLASIGIYQLTSNVLNEKANLGASRINKALPEEMRIPGSIVYLEGWDHERVVHMNMIAALADKISRMDNTTIKHLKKMNDEDYSLMLGGIHHRPRDAKRAIEYWSANDAQFPLINSMNDRLTNYNSQVKSNSAGLEAYLSNQVSIRQ